MRSLLRKILDRHDTVIWIRVVGTVLTTFASFMLRPFLALYLYDRLDQNLFLAAVVTSLQPLTGMVASIWSGGLADRWGRKPMMVLSLVIQSVSMACYIWADSLMAFASITVLNGIGGALYWPAASAQVADVVPEERRSEAYALLHTALNVGAAAGPLIGVVVYRIEPRITFSICSGTLALYALLVVWKIPETLRRRAHPSLTEAGPAPRFRLSEHTTLLWMTLAAVPVSLLYSQVEIVLPLHLKSRFDDFLTVFATLITINGSLVVTCQLLIARGAERFLAHRVILVAYVCFAIVGVGYGWAPSFLFLVATEAVFTLGEMLFGPQIQKAVSMLAAPEYRARYFAIFGLNHGLMRTLGPPVGALAFDLVGGPAWFSGIGILVAVAAVFQVRCVRKAAAVAAEERRPSEPRSESTRRAVTPVTS